MQPSLDPLKRARILARFDREREAREVLAKAVRAEPHRLDLQQELADLEHRERHLGHLGASRHAAAAWLLLLISYAVTFGPIALLIHAARQDIDTLNLEGASLVIGISLALSLVVALVYFATSLFLRLWFRRLAAMPAQDRPLAEAALWKSMNEAALQPLYSKARAKYLGADA